jgi:nucleotide-binding universal stress UspA family protein
MTDKSMIIVPLDWSEQSLIALDQACNVAETLNASIHLVYVKDAPGLFGSKEHEDDVHREILAKLNETGEGIRRERNFSVTSEVRTGKIYEEINEVADELKASFIIMGTAGSHGLKKKFIGSNALRVVKQSHTPVITIKGKRHTKGCKIIVLPLDLTKETREKVGKAIEFGKAFGSLIITVSVIETDDEFVINHLKRQMTQVHTYVEEHGVQVTSDLVNKKGSVADTILEFSKNVNADLLMIMTQQETDFTDLFIGSQAQVIINNSEIPVLSIIPRPHEMSSPIFT